ncbi:macrolide 2'-phosphotransferase [Pseudarthrobacter sp. PS3-L1]|uniref:macrolide 2'-phosphotransferase n=1 Tax=Pseudarthrobacter sp. PS3-L1 TaxID=3046207 RepID=UPI0024BB6E25|nr:macrolide 2'-phosphotransferase [Pseudarthrobacter sp. PS3-L1]MDJ0321450.1 macrolide 2'-phosphotransferase [Pseudarthrobacter sp. PS3-L1]
MRRKPIELAAVATAAVPGLTPTAVSAAPDDPADFNTAFLVDSEGKRWRVRSPQHPEASARLETEFLVLRAFTPAIRAELPFLMPTVAGKVRLGDLSTFVYSHLTGTHFSIDQLSSGNDSVAIELGAALAAIHDLPQSLVNNADLPSYTPNEFRQRRLNELDQAAMTGKIPAALLRRWEHAMEDVSLWRFNPSVVHGDLHEDNLLIDAGKVAAVTGWTDLRIGDPADDFAWLVASSEQSFVDAVLASYTAARRDTPDKHLLRRAALSAEFALAQYLVKALNTSDADMIADAEEMLQTLASDITVHGGQPLGVEPLPQPATAAPLDNSSTREGAKDASGRIAQHNSTPTGAGAVTAKSTDDAGASSPGSLPVPATPAVYVTPIPEEKVTPSDGKAGADTAIAGNRPLDEKASDGSSPTEGTAKVPGTDAPEQVDRNDEHTTDPEPPTDAIRIVDAPKP